MKTKNDFSTTKKSQNKNDDVDYINSQLALLDRKTLPEEILKNILLFILIILLIMFIAGISWLVLNKLNIFTNS